MNSNSQKRRDFMLKLAQTIGIAGTSVIASSAFAKGRAASIKSVSLKKNLEHGEQRLVFELDKSVRHSIFTLHSPERVVIDFKNTQETAHLKVGRAAKNSKLLKKIRQASRNKTDLRVVLDLTEKAKATAKLQAVKSGYRLEVALKPRLKAKSVSSIEKASKAVTAAVGRRASRKPMVIAIDAGHGGKDPGAVGRRGTREKAVVLKIAERLAKKINREAGMKAILIRDGDYYVSLRKRIAKARAKKADLFISIHADANPSRKLTGSSVYILSENGASSEAARWLASSENSYEKRLAGAHLQRSNKVVSSMLLDLSLSDTIDKSLDLANGVLKELGSVNRLLRHRVESAGFVVLKSPDIPSMLIETAFISNPQEEKRLKTSHYQEKLAKAIFKGVHRYKVAMHDVLDEAEDRMALQIHQEREKTFIS